MFKTTKKSASILATEGLDLFRSAILKLSNSNSVAQETKENNTNSIISLKNSILLIEDENAELESLVSKNKKVIDNISTLIGE